MRHFSVILLVLCMLLPPVLVSGDGRRARAAGPGSLHARDRRRLHRRPAAPAGGQRPPAGRFADQHRRLPEGLRPAALRDVGPGQRHDPGRGRALPLPVRRGPGRAVACQPHGRRAGELCAPERGPRRAGGRDPGAQPPALQRGPGALRGGGPGRAAAPLSSRRPEDRTRGDRAARGSGPAPAAAAGEHRSARRAAEQPRSPGAGARRPAVLAARRTLPGRAQRGRPHRGNRIARKTARGEPATSGDPAAGDPRPSRKT